MTPLLLMLVAVLPLWSISCASSPPPTPAAIQASQVPAWSQDDMNFFLHGSMGSEFVPETVLRAFIKTYPDLFPTSDFSPLGVIADPTFGWPIGFSRSEPAHLAKMPSVGINCASCHVGEVDSPDGRERVRVLGMTSHFDVEGFFNSIIGATFRTQDPVNMKRFISAYLEQASMNFDHVGFSTAWDIQSTQIVAAMAADPSGAKGAGPGGLQTLDPSEFRISRLQLSDNSVDFASLSLSMLKLFHNMRAALHVPDQPPKNLPSLSGPGRNDAFGLLSAALLNEPIGYAPVKYGLVWNMEHRYWVHWDGDTRSPIARNLLATLGLGAPLIGKQGQLDFALIKRQTELSEKIISPKYPFAIDQSAAKRGVSLYQRSCAACHDGPEDDHRLRSTSEVWTDPTRARLFTKQQADRFNKFITELEIENYSKPAESGVRSTQKYWAASLAGVWARSPYLHNGSVRTMQQLLTPPASRDVTFHRGSRTYDSEHMGYRNFGSYLFDTKIPGNANTGHDYGTGLTSDQKQDLMEYLKTL